MLSDKGKDPVLGSVAFPCRQGAGGHGSRYRERHLLDGDERRRRATGDPVIEQDGRSQNLAHRRLGDFADSFAGDRAPTKRPIL